ncbi:MAG: T9SS type A sorting domain-containing protein, partial [Ekhidna sp.]|nr:T9SS type A sorting domain-containing protein [Ekhidna sp.]
APPYLQSFETGDHGWEVSGGEWELGEPANTILNSASDGSQAFVTDLDGAYSNGSVAFLASPLMDFSDETATEVSLDINFSIEDSWDGAVLLYRTDLSGDFNILPLEAGISNWYNSTASALGGAPAWSGFSGGYVNARADLSFLSGEPLVQFAVLFASDGSVTDEGISVDAFYVGEAIESDLAAIAVVNPGRSVQGEEFVSAVIANRGINDATDFEVAYAVNGSEVERLIVSEEFVAGDVAEIEFETPFDFSDPGEYEITVTVELEGDQVASNNSISASSFNVDFVGAYVLSQDALTESSFSAEFSGGIVFDGDNIVIIDVVDVDTRSFDAIYLEPLGIGQAPASFEFDLTDAGEVIFNEDQLSGLSFNGESITLGEADTPGSYTEGDDSQFTLTLKENSTQIGQRPAVNVGFTVNRIPDNDLILADIVAPVGESIRRNQAIVIEVVNGGVLPVEEFQASYSVDGIVVATETVTGDLFLGESTEFVFSTPFDFSVEGEYELSVSVSLTGDENPDNDDLTTTIVANTFFAGEYFLIQDAPTTQAVSAIFGNGSVFNGGPVSNIFIEAVDDSTRIFSATYLSELGLDNQNLYSFTLGEDGEVVFGDNQGTFIGCNGEILIGTADTAGSYNPEDDSEFTLTVREDVFENCGVPFEDVTFTLKRIEGPELAVGLVTMPVLPLGVEELGVDLINSGLPGDVEFSLELYVNNALINTTNFEGVVDAGEVFDVDLDPIDFAGLTGTVEVEVVLVFDDAFDFNNRKGYVINVEEYETLLTFYESTNGDEWFSNGGWLSELPYENWFGLTVDPTTGQVVNIDLSGNGLSGQLPAEIGNFAALERLGIPNNAIGGEIPAELGQVTTLQRIGLRNNQLTGEIPESIAVLEGLTHLNVHENALTGIAPEFARGTYSSFNVSFNQLEFDDIVPVVDALTAYAPQQRLAEERIFATTGTEYTLDINTGDDGSNLYSWFLNDVLLDDVTGPTLTFTYESDQFAGIYTAIATNDAAPALALVKEFEVVSPSVQEIPDFDALVAFYDATGGENWFEDSGWFVDPDISNWFGISSDQGGNVIQIFLTGNGLSGMLPSEIGDMLSLQELYLGGNQIGGEIPAEIANLTQLSSLSMPRNNFVGTIPAELGELDNLVFLGLSNNQLSGDIPSELGNISSLSRIGLRNNRLEGSVPASLTDLQNLVNLNLHENQFTGLPDFSGNTTLEVFQVQDNQLGFDDLVPNADVLTGYIPQAPIDDLIEELVNEGDSYSMSVSDVTDGNIYTWFLDGDLIDAVGDIYLIESVAVDDAGTYTVAIENEALPGLIIARNPVVIEVNPAPKDLNLSANTVAESVAIGTEVGVFSASDDEEVTFSIAGDVTSAFEVVGNALNTTVDLDFETTASYAFTLTAIDALGAVSTEELIIEVTDVNEAPIVTDADFMIDELVEAGTEVGIIEFSDPEGDDLTVSIVAGNTGDAFAVDNNGVLTVNLAEPLDIDDNPNFSLTIDVSDGEFITSATVSVDLLDVNESPIVEDAVFEINGRPDQGAEVGSLVFSDPENDDLSFEITAGNSAGIFAIDNQGVITAAAPDQFSSNDPIELIVAVSDDEFTVEANVTFNLSNVLSVQIKELEVYPNPSTGRFIISGAVLASSDSKISVIDLAGKAVSFELSRISEIQRELRINSDFTGTLLIRIETKDGTVDRKVVIQ